MSFNEFKYTEFGKVNDEWSINKLGDFITTLTDYHANGSYEKLKENVELLDEENYAIMIRTTNFEQKNFRKNGFKYITKHAYNFLDKSKVYADDILMNKIANAGSVYLMPNLMKPVSLAMNLFLIRLNEDKINRKYGYYFLSNYERYVKTRASGSVTKTITKDNVRKLEIAYPNIIEQNLIVSTLSSIEDKIELNNSINETLEEMAQAIFINWFINFKQFQNEEFEQSELGMIPKGWRVGTLGELISDTLGGDWGKEIPQGNFVEEVTCIRGADIPEIASGKKGKPATRFILKKNLEKKQLSAGQIIIEISGGSPTQSTGRTALITEELVAISDKPLICTNFCRALSLEKNSHSTFVYSMLQYLYKIDLFFQYENGTTGIKNLDTNNLFNKYQIILPTDEIMVEYEAVFSTLIKSIYKNGSQSDKLSDIRDTLLPKLMSGEIRVPIK